MEKNNELKLFEDKKIRTKWNEEQEKWYFSVVDVVTVLTENEINRWKILQYRCNEY